MTYLEEYINSRPIIGKSLKAILDRLQRESVEDSRFIYDTKKAHLYIDFIEKFVKGAKSPYYGKPTQLLLWQKAYIEVLYSFKWKETGRSGKGRFFMPEFPSCRKSKLSEAVFGGI